MRQYLLIGLLACALIASAQTDNRVTPPPVALYTAIEQPLFKTLPGQTPYRIPAIAMNHRGELIAVSDFRPCGGDIGFGRVDLRYRISKNNGATWSPEYLMAQGDGIKGSKTCGYGDAAIVADRNSDEAIVVCVTGNTVYGHSTTTRKNPNRIAIIRSTDGGNSWKRPEEITEPLYSLFDKSETGPIAAMFFGSGRICQSRQIRIGQYYRLYAALCARPGGNRVVYSDDMGRTWHALASARTSPAPESDEPKIEELPDGSVVLSGRMSGGRFFNIFHYISRRNGAGTWEKFPVASAEQPNGIVARQNSTNGEILFVDAIENSTGKQVRMALHSVPLGPGRNNVGIYYKKLPDWKPTAPEWKNYTAKDFATNWSKPYQVSQLGSAYSTMIQQEDGRIAFFYEEETYGKGLCYTNMYIPIDLEQITAGAFRAVRSQKPQPVRRKPHLF